MPSNFSNYKNFRDGRIKMKILRLFLLCIISFLAPASGALAQAPYPTQQVTIVVPFAAGSNTDILARYLAEKLTPIWKQNVIVENRPGVPGTISAANSTPDGHTLMMTSNGHTILERYQQRPDHRSGEGFRRRHSGRLGSCGSGRPAGVAGEDPERTDRSRKGKAGNLEFLVGRACQFELHRRRTSQADGEDRHRPHPL